MNWKTANWIGAALLTVMVAVSVAPAWAADANLQVKTKQGKVEGRMDGDVKAFLGIPFAALPVGPLRWKPPVPAEKWIGVRLATDRYHLVSNLSEAVERDVQQLQIDARKQLAQSKVRESGATNELTLIEARRQRCRQARYQR
jgi:hypothetical protein